MNAATEQEKVPLSAVEMAQGLAKPDGKPRRPFAHRAWICNITEMAWPYMYLTYGQFKIDGKKPGEKYHLEVITASIQRTDRGEKNSTTEEIGALDIADDMVRMINENAGQDSYLGLFVVEFGKQPTAEQLAKAHAKLRKYGTHYCQIASEEFARYGRGSWIPDLARFFAKYLGLEDQPYLLEAPPQTKCPSCMKPIVAGTIKCPTCHAILDEEKARKYHLLPGQQEPEKKRPGKGKAQEAYPKD